MLEVRAAIEAGVPGVLGIHIEGPFLNPEPGYIGAHPAAHARPADADTMRRLLEAAGYVEVAVDLGTPESLKPRLRSQVLAERVYVA